jgi:hypothetical protein
MPNGHGSMSETNFLEPTPIGDAFVTNIAAREDLGGCVRIVLSAPRKFPASSMANVVNARLVIPVEYLPQFAEEIRRIAAEYGTIAPSIAPGPHRH